MRGEAPSPGSGFAAALRAGRILAGGSALAGVTLAALLGGLAGASAQETDTPTNLFGSRGLMGTPSARMAPDGELSVGASFLKNNQHYNLGFQVLPWLQAEFRYSGLQHFNPSYPVYYDRAFGIKARLWNEDEAGLLPAVAVGIDDLIGTGVYAGEYVVASKRFGDIDTSLGMGWGRRASTELMRNPLALIFPSFDHRSNTLSNAGVGNFNAFFHGHNVGLFGGAVWHTPLDGLSLMVEYDSDTYMQERAADNLNPRSQVNYGLSYNLTDQTILGLDWLYGTTLGGSFSLRLDPVHPQYPQKIEPPPPAVTVRSGEQQQQALAALLEMRDPGNVRRIRLFESRNADRNDFVDALWRQGGAQGGSQGSDVADIQVRQSVLELTVTGPVSSTRCVAVARLMQGVAMGVSRVKLKDSDGRHSLVCAVPRTVEAAPASAVFLAAGGLENIAMPVAEILTIDASAVTPGPSRAQAEHAIRAAIAAQSISVEALSLGPGELTLYYRNLHYQAETDAIDRIVRVLTKEAPPDIEKFRLIPVETSVPLQEFDVLRAPVERSYQQESETIFDHSVSIRPPAMNQPVMMAASSQLYPRFSWGFYPQFRQALFDPNQPFGVQFLAAAGAGVELAPGLSIFGSVEASLYDNFDTSRVSDSLLPHVRSDFMKYFTQGKTGISDLQASYMFRLTPTIYVRTRAGYLESMFAGGGGEILWRPQGARWALGADAYQVWQRDFDRLFGLQHYHQTTGHVSLYYDSPWYDLNFMLRAGQYLAGDRGLTFQVTRRFATGVEIGAFVTKTNVSATQFGEGSFDKGIVIRIPLGWVAPIESQSMLGLDLRPVQRDGGQALNGDATLYEETRAASQGELLRQQSGIMAGW
ncbi:MAG TPA: YjbH domain-containing protein [Rhizomicrobium sp.]|nr:YjbH domain-containing protein [Rhizomicrobium sp.]